MKCSRECCNNEVTNNKRKFCSVECANKEKPKSDEFREKLSKHFSLKLPTNEIVELFAQNIPIYKIAELYGCNKQTITNHLKRTGNWKERKRSDVQKTVENREINSPSNCSFCLKECKNSNSLKQHEIRCKQNPNKIQNIGNIISSKIGGWKTNNGSTKAKERGETYVVSDETREKLRKAASGKKWSAEQKKAQSELMKKVVRENPESYSSQNVNGRIKQYEFNGMKFDGKWELKVAECLHSENIEFTNSIHPIEYEFNGNIHLYFPDFYLPDFDLYIEVKGLVRDKDPYKWASLENLIIFKQTEIKRLDSEKVLDLILELRNKKHKGM